jgi:Domain of unknown function (DUF4440)
MRFKPLFPKTPVVPRDAQPPGAQTATAAVRHLNEEYLAAARSNDGSWFTHHLAEDAVVILGDGRRLRKLDFLATLHDQPWPFRSLEACDVTLRVIGPIVQVDADAPWELEDGSTGVSRYIDTWAWLDGRWQVISAQVTWLPQRS